MNNSILKSFADDKRLTILELLKNNEICACELLASLNISQSTLSHHMKILVDAQLVQARKSGKWTYYSINKAGLFKAKQAIDYFLE